MEKQNNLFEKKKTTYSLSEEIKDLKEYHFDKFPKIIAEFGNLKSKILILGISCVQKHYDSESHSCFAFDINQNQDKQSGGILCKTFERLGIKIDSVLFDNIYKCPETMLGEESRYSAMQYMEKFIKMINPKIIVVLGNDCESIVNKLEIDDTIKIKKVRHPGCVLRNFYTLDEYIKNWERLNLQEYLK